GYALVDRQLYLPADWAADPKRRRATRVPEGVAFQESWRIGLRLLDRARADLPGGWVTGDDEVGRASGPRAALRCRRPGLARHGPSNTSIRDLGAPPPPGRRRPPWRRVAAWAKALPPARWRQVRVGDGSKGPKVVWAAAAWVQTRDEDGCPGP